MIDLEFISGLCKNIFILFGMNLYGIKDELIVELK